MTTDRCGSEQSTSTKVWESFGDRQSLAHPRHWLCGHCASDKCSRRSTGHLRRTNEELGVLLEEKHPSVTRWKLSHSCDSVVNHKINEMFTRDGAKAKHQMIPLSQKSRVVKIIVEMKGSGPGVDE